MPRTVTLRQQGWIVAGLATIRFWMGGEGQIIMDEQFVPLGQMTRDNLHRCINDGKFGCQSIESAELHIFDAFENGYREFNRTLAVKHPDPNLALRGI